MQHVSKLIVFTDIHMTVKLRAGCPEPESRLRAGLAHALSSVPDADMILLMGDLTHWGDRGAYRKLRAVLEDVPLPVVPMLGNHDNRAKFREIFPETPVDGSGFVQRVIPLGAHRLITLDTLIAPREGDAFSHAGELCPARLAWLDAALTEAGDAPCIVAMHHPPHATGFEAMDGIMLRDGEAFHDLIARHGTVQQILCGHIHRTIFGSYRGTPYAVFKSPVGQMPLIFAGDDTSVECHDPPAFGIVIAHDSGVMVHTEDFPAP